MNCCQCQGIEQVFAEERAKDELEEYRRKGLKKTTRYLVEAIQQAVGENGRFSADTLPTLLDIGGGIGSIQHTLANDVDAIINVDASSAYLATAQSEATKIGYANKAVYKHGDFVDLAAEITAVDIVTLDRVICCYHDMEALVSRSAAKANTLYALVYPRDVWWVKIFRPLATFGLWLARNPFRLFVHSSHAVDTLVSQHGFARTYYKTAGMWQVIVYQKV